MLRSSRSPIAAVHTSLVKTMRSGASGDLALPLDRMARLDVADAELAQGVDHGLPADHANRQDMGHHGAQREAAASTGIRRTSPPSPPSCSTRSAAAT